MRYYPLILLPVLACALVTDLPGQPSPVASCDPDLEPLRDNPYGYRLRDDRCEGLFVQPLSASGALRLVSFTRSRKPANPNEGSEVNLHWPPAGRAPIAVRANVLRRNFYYRMDTVLSPGVSSYSWATDLLQAVGLKEGEIGLLAWTDETIAGRAEKVLLPISIGDPQASRASDYTMEIMSAEELTEVYVSVARILESSEEAVMTAKPLALGYYPAQRPIRVVLPQLGETGLYRVEIAASLGDGSAVAIDFKFRHHPAST